MVLPLERGDSSDVGRGRARKITEGLTKLPMCFNLLAPEFYI